MTLLQSCKGFGMRFNLLQIPTGTECTAAATPTPALTGRLSHSAKRHTHGPEILCSGTLDSKPFPYPSSHGLRSLPGLRDLWFVFDTILVPRRGLGGVSEVYGLQKLCEQESPKQCLQFAVGFLRCWGIGLCVNQPSSVYLGWYDGISLKAS